MSKYYDDLQKIFHQYELKHDRMPSALREVIAWAATEGLLKAPDIDPFDKLAEDMAKALREEYQIDAYGRKYRLNHAVRITKSGAQFTFWANMHTAPRPHMEKAFAQRRKQIVGDCLQLKTDVDVYNDANPTETPIQMILDFTYDVEEEQAMRGHPPKKAA